MQGENGKPREDLTMAATIVGGGGTPQAITLRQVAPGEYRGSVASPSPGTYLVQIAGSSDGHAAVQEVAGLVVPYSPEYRQGQGNPGLLAELAKITGGGALAAPAAAFEHNLPSVSRAQEIALPLLLLALLLLPLDIAARRLLLRRADLEAAREWARARLPRRPVTPAADPTLARLGEAKRRAVERPRRGVSTAPGATRPTARPRSAQRPPPRPTPTTRSPACARPATARDARLEGKSKG